MLKRLRYRGHRKVIVHLNFTKALKCEYVYKLCLWILEEHVCLILTNQHVLRLKYRGTYLPNIDTTASSQYLCHLFINVRCTVLLNFNKIMIQGCMRLHTINVKIF